MDNLLISQNLINFIKEGVTPFHVVAEVSRRLENEGFERLQENENWVLEKGHSYYVVRNHTALMAFRVPLCEPQGYQIIASHCDSPCFKCKEEADLGKGIFASLNVEKYGGMILSTWFDRPLSLAGRVMVNTDKGLETRLYRASETLCSIPSLAIHFNRDINDGHKYNVQKELMPIIGLGDLNLQDLVAEEMDVAPKSIMGMDLFLYNKEEGNIWGADSEFVSAPRLDDLQCVYGSLEGFCAAQESGNIPVLAIFDNEEVGSTTKQGAASTFLLDTLKRTALALGYDEEKYLTMIAGSFMVSADNAHSLHPNYTEMYDALNQTVINGGIVIKYNANQKYTTDAVSSAVCKLVCGKAGVPYQTFANRSDLAGGSTLGNISNTQVSLNTVDIGLAQLAMHSAYETAGTKDTGMLILFAKAFYNMTLIREGDTYRLD